MRHELLIEFTGLSLPPLQSVLAAAGFILFHACVHIGLARLEHPVDQTGAVVGHGRDGCGGAESCPEASIVGAQGVLTVQQRLRSPAQGVGGAGAHGAGAALEPVAPAEPVVGTQTAPGGEVLFGVPPAPIQADRGEEGWRREHLDAVQAGHVDTTHTGEWGGQIAVRLVASGVLGPTLGEGRGGGVDLDLAVNGVAVGCDAGGARGALLLVDCREFQGLAQLEEPRFAPVARQTVGAGVGAGVDAIIFEGGERGGVACAGQQGAANGHARHPAEVTDDMGEVDVHCGAGFWPVLEAGGSGAEEGVALASGGPSHAARSGGTKGAGAQTARVKFWPPRAVGDGGFAPGQVLRLTGVDQVDRNAPRVQDWAQGAPVHSWAFPHPRVAVAGVEPVGHGLEGGRKTGTAAYRLWRALWGHGHLVLGATSVETRSSAVQRRQSSGRIPWAVGTSGVFYGRWASSSLRCASRAVQERGPARVRIRMRLSPTGSRPAVQQDEGPATTQGTAPKGVVDAHHGVQLTAYSVRCAGERRISCPVQRMRTHDA